MVGARNFKCFVVEMRRMGSYSTQETVLYRMILLKFWMQGKIIRQQRKR